MPVVTRGVSLSPVEPRSTRGKVTTLEFMEREQAHLPDSMTDSYPVQGSTYTGIPTQASFSRYSAFQFASRKQPCDSVRPTCSGLGVP